MVGPVTAKRGAGTVPAERLPRLRAAAQLLHRPRDMRHPADVARWICGAQSQEVMAGRLALRARGTGFTGADVDRARSEERSLLRTWAMRMTVHLIAADDAGWLLPLFEPLMVANSRRRLEQLGMPASQRDRALHELRRALATDGPLTRGDAAGRIERAGVSLNASTRLHVFRLAVAGGIACMGPDRGSQACLAPRAEWLGPPPAHDRDAALRELARRYLGAFGPATEADFAKWSGLPLRDLRAGLSGIAGELRELRIGADRAWALRRGARTARGRVVRLLPRWDTYLMGHRDREFIAGRDRWSSISDGGGMLNATIVVDGVAAGTWSLRAGRPGLGIELSPFRPLEPDVAAAVEAEVADVRRFEGV
jgi:hypothetical protein